MPATAWTPIWWHMSVTKLHHALTEAHVDNFCTRLYTARPKMSVHESAFGTTPFLCDIGEQSAISLLTVCDCSMRSTQVHDLRYQLFSTIRRGFSVVSCRTHARLFWYSWARYSGIVINCTRSFLADSGSGSTQTPSLSPALQPQSVQTYVSLPSVCQSVCFHSVFWTVWPLNWSFYAAAAADFILILFIVWRLWP